MCVFYAPAPEIAQWAQADPLTEKNPQGTQRILNGYRVSQVGRYFDADPRNSIPTAVIVGFPKNGVDFEKDAAGKNHKIAISRSLRKPPPGLIIDGQHRVHGSLEFQGETIYLCVIALIEIDNDESAFQFLVINNKGMKVSRDHLKNLNLQYDQKTLAKRLADSAGLGLSEAAHVVLERADRESGSPFYKILDWPTNSKRWVAPQAIELGFKQIDGVKRDLRGTEMDFFLSIWTAIKKAWPDLWKDPSLGESRLLQKVSIYALTKVIADKLFRWAEHPVNPLDLRVDGQVRELTTAILGKLHQGFWIGEWAIKELDTTLGRNKVKEALETMYDNIDNGLTWNTDIAWVSSIEPSEVIARKPTAKKVAARKAAAKRSR